MAHDAREIANFFIDQAHRQGLILTHLSLQKILYFAHAWHLAKYDGPLLGQPFEAWQYGPVVRVVFDQLKVLGSNPIQTKLKKIDVKTGRFFEAKAVLEAGEEQFLSDIFEYYAKFDAGRLVDLTHEDGGPWDKVWKSALHQPVIGMYIPDDSIKLWILREGGRGDLIRH